MSAVTRNCWGRPTIILLGKNTSGPTVPQHFSFKKAPIGHQHASFKFPAKIFATIKSANKRRDNQRVCAQNESNPPPARWKDSTEDLNLDSLRSVLRDQVPPASDIQTVLDEMLKYTALIGDSRCSEILKQAKLEAESPNCDPLLVLKLFRDCMTLMDSGFELDGDVRSLATLSMDDAVETTSRDVDSLGDESAISEKDFEELKTCILEVVSRIEEQEKLPRSIVEQAVEMRDRILSEECTFDMAEDMFAKLMQVLNEFMSESIKADDFGFDREVAELDELRSQAELAVAELERMEDAESLSLAHTLRSELSGGDWSPAKLINMLEKVVSYVGRREALEASRNLPGNDLPPTPSNAPRFDASDLKLELNSLAVEAMDLFSSGNSGAALSLVDANYASVSGQLSEGIHGLEQLSMLHVLSHLYIQMGSGRAAGVLSQASKLAMELETDPSLTWDILANIGDQHKSLRDIQSGAQFYSLALKTMERDNEPLLKRKYVLMSLVEARCKLAQWEAAKSAAEPYLDLFGAAGHDSEALALSRYLGTIYMALEEYISAEKVLRKNLLALAEDEDGNVKEIAITKLFLGRIHQEMGEFRYAADLLQDGISTFDGVKWGDVAEEDTQNLAFAKKCLEAAKAELAQQDEMEQALQRALESAAATAQQQNNPARENNNNSNSNAPVATAMLQLAQFYAETMQFDKAVFSLGEVVRFMEATMASSALIPNALSQLAICHLMVGDVEQAEGAARKNLQFCTEKFGASSPRSAEASTLLAEALLERGDSCPRAEVERLLSFSLMSCAETFGPESREMIGPLEVLLDAAGKFGDGDRARLLASQIESLKNRHRISE